MKKIVCKVYYRTLFYSGWQRKTWHPRASAPNFHSPSHSDGWGSLPLKAARGSGQESPARLLRSIATPFIMATIVTRRTNASVRKMTKFHDPKSLPMTEVNDGLTVARDRFFVIIIPPISTVSYRREKCQGETWGILRIAHMKLLDGQSSEKEFKNFSRRLTRMAETLRAHGINPEDVHGWCGAEGEGMSRYLRWNMWYIHVSSLLQQVREGQTKGK